MGFVYLFLYFLVVDNAIALFNYFFRDFRGFRDCRVFDLDGCHSCKLFHKRLSCAKTGTYRQFDQIRYVFKIWFNRSEKAPLQMFDFVLNIPL